jgi:2-dehydropantoate 2-reductase
MKKILIIGAGAIGGFYGAKLSQSGAEVTLLCRSDYDQVKKNGMEIKSYLGDFNFKPHQIIRNSNEYKDVPDYVLVTTKVLPEINLKELLSPVIKKDTAIVLIQNGIHIEQAFVDLFPNQELISILAFVCVSKIDKGKIFHQDYGKLIIGNFPRLYSKKAEHLAYLWKKSGIDVELSQDILKDRWKKLIWNAAFNPISVLSGGYNTSEILKNYATKNLAINVMNEVLLLSKLDGVLIEEDVIEKNISMTEKMKPYKTSMLLDFEANRKLEIEAILGNALKFAKEKSIAVPYISTLYALLTCY